MIRRSKRALKRSKMVLELDKACRLEVFERDLGICQRCGSTLMLQWSHVHSRRHHCLRWDPDNSKVLCRDCHCWWTNNPGLAYDWFIKKFPERWERITRVLQANPKVNMKSKLEELEKR